MRYHELSEARPWKQYKGRRYRIRLIRNAQIAGRDEGPLNCFAFFGDVLTGRQEVFQDQFVSIVLPDGEELFGEHPHSLHAAFEQVSAEAERTGWRVVALGRSPEFYETGLSVNTGFGFHPDVPNRHVHMSEIPPNDDVDN